MSASGSSGSSEEIYRGQLLALRVDTLPEPAGGTRRIEIVEHPGAVAIVALQDDGQVVLVHQYRHPVRTFLYELPAGLLDMLGEAPLEAARRELFEETGLVAADWSVLLDIFTSPGMTDEVIRIYLARGISESTDRFQPEDEEITMTVVRLPLDDALARVQSGQITNAAAVAGICATVLARDAEWRPLRPTDAPWLGEQGRAAS